MKAATVNESDDSKEAQRPPSAVRSERFNMKMSIMDIFGLLLLPHFNKPTYRFKHTVQSVSQLQSFHSKAVPKGQKMIDNLTISEYSNEYIHRRMLNNSN